VYNEYLRIATIRVEMGEANPIERLTIQSTLNEYQLLLKQATLEIGNLEKQLANLLNAAQAVTTTDSLTTMPFVQTDSLNNLQVQLVMQDIQIEQANTELLKTTLKPDFNVGYSLQNYFEGGWLHGLQAGVQIPLFTKQTKLKVEAQQLQIEVAKAKVEAEKQQMQQELLSVENAIELYALGINYYREQLESVNLEMERVSKLNYQAGEISYLELLNTINLLANNKQRYWEQVLLHNQAVVLYQFFSN
ncbi:MAG: TolC family protein, partial [Chitinophagales bacterium]